MIGLRKKLADAQEFMPVTQMFSTLPFLLTHDLQNQSPMQEFSRFGGFSGPVVAGLMYDIQGSSHGFPVFCRHSGTVLSVLDGDGCSRCSSDSERKDRVLQSNPSKGAISVSGAAPSSRNFRAVTRTRLSKEPTALL